MRLHQNSMDFEGGVLHFSDPASIMFSNKTRQGYARKCILKPAGYSFMGLQS